MIRKLLIANRGEIALRIIRACKEMGIATVAVYSEADAGAPHARLADEAVLIGPGPAKHSYLLSDKIVSKALAAGCDAVHPGYGFLAENPEFAGLCESSGLIFVGPTAETIGLMGTKTKAREVMAAAGVPVLPATGELHTVEEALAGAEATGFPAILKALAGGGGIGQKVVRSRDELARETPLVQERAELVFKNKGVFLERYLERARHVEVQVLGFPDASPVHLFERECSIQRRYQKVVEEAPAPALDDGLREALLACAVAGARRIGYLGAGTLEFLFDPAEGRFFFMEMNTRLQVEHAVTEMTTGIDLVKEQLRIAGGPCDPLAQAAIRRTGHAVELRVYAEDPARGFAPQPGKLGRVEWPSGDGVRCDWGYEAGQTVPPFYDPLLAKVVAHGETRTAALDRAAEALDRTVVEGIRTNLPLLRRIVRDEAFRRGVFDTTYLTERKDLLQ